MRIFFVCQRVPFPPDRGDKIASFNEIRHLSAQHEVHVFCLGDGARDLDNIPGLRAYAKSITAVPVDALTIKLRAAKALLIGEPLSVAALNEVKLHAAIRHKFSELNPDLIIVYSCNVAQFAEHFSGVPRIMRAGADPRGDVYDLRKPAGRRCAEAGSANWGDGDRPGVGHATLSRSGRGICCAIADGARGSEQTSRGGGNGVALRRVECRLEGHCHCRWRRYSGGG
jgi:hypothetical protein